jgi:hypothetical protein
MAESTQPARRRRQRENFENSGRAGIGVDYWGGQVIDPTKNVENLVAAGREQATELRAADQRFLDAQLSTTEKLQDFAREAESRLQSFAREAGEKLQKALLDAETRRIDQLAAQAQTFQNTIRDMLAESVRTTSTLVSTQLVQIQATFDTRVSKLEAGAFTAAGRSSVQDPQTADALSRMAAGISSFSATTTDSMTRLTQAIANMQSAESGTGGQRKGMQDSNARLLSVVMAVAAVASPVISILVTIMVMRGH